jgi:hypothetical protein
MSGPWPEGIKSQPAGGWPDEPIHPTDRRPSDLATDRGRQGPGVSRRTIERERSAGRFPLPDLHIGKAPLWRPETIRRWVEGGGS